MGSNPATPTKVSCSFFKEKRTKKPFCSASRGVGTGGGHTDIRGPGPVTCGAAKWRLKSTKTALDKACDLGSHINMKYVLGLALFACAILSGCAAAPPSGPVVTPPYQQKSVVLYQPDDVLLARLGMEGQNSVPAYIGRINTALTGVFSKAPAQSGVTAAIVLGVKPGGAVRAWIVAPPGAFSDDFTAQLQAAAQAVPPLPVQNGPVALAIIFNAWGGGPPLPSGTNPPTPKEWMAGAKGAEAVPDGVFARIWP